MFIFISNFGKQKYTPICSKCFFKYKIQSNLTNKQIVFITITISISPIPTSKQLSSQIFICTMCNSNSMLVATTNKFRLIDFNHLRFNIKQKLIINKLEKNI